MADERPPTQDEIQDLRQRIQDYIQQNGKDWINEIDLKRLLREDYYVSRFFMHCTDIPGDHLKNTEEMIIRSFKFRKEKNVHAIKSSDLDETLKDKGSLYLRNRDADGKQLLIFEVKKHVKGTANMEDMQKMFLYFLERVDREDDDGMVTIVFDCAGCGLKNMDMEFIRYMIDVLKDYYPWNLNWILVLDMPWVLNAAWKIIKAWLPAGAVKKIKFVNKNTVDDYIRPEQKLLAWGGTDPWQYEFVEESVMLTPEEPARMNGINGHSTSSEEENAVLQDEKKPFGSSMTSYSSVRSTTSFATSEAEQRITTISPNVSFSMDRDKSPVEYEVSPDYELVFIKSPKGLMATISLTNKSVQPMAFKIKTTSPERYRVRPSLGLIGPTSLIKIEVFYQPITPDSDDFSDVLKDKFLITILSNTSEDSYKTDIKDKKPSHQHRLKASVKKSLLKNIPEKRETPNVVDKDKDVYLKELKILERKNQQIHEEIQSISTFIRIILFLTVIMAFMVAMQFYSQSTISSSLCGGSTPEDAVVMEESAQHHTSIPDDL